MTNNCGVYQIKNTITGDFYIGSSCDIRKRIWQHRKELLGNKHGNPHLQNSWNKRGEQAFEFTTILFCDIESKLYYEQVLIDGLKPAYNIAANAAAPWQGLHLSDETRAKMSKSQMGRKQTDEAKRKISEARKGKPNGRLGKRLSDETRAKMSASQSGESHPNFGKHLSEETRAKISEAEKGELGNMFGRRHTEEARAKMSEASKGNQRGHGNLGKRRSDETRAKMSAAHKKCWMERIA
jgi:group I intron endonuclease